MQATVLPSVAAALLGGANGPLHSAVAATLPSLPRPLWRGYLLRVSLVAAAVGAAAAFALACVAGACFACACSDGACCGVQPFQYFRWTPQHR